MIQFKGFNVESGLPAIGIGFNPEDLFRLIKGQPFKGFLDILGTKFELVIIAGESDEAIKNEVNRPKYTFTTVR